MLDVLDLVFSSLVGCLFTLKCNGLVMVKLHSTLPYGHFGSFWVQFTSHKMVSLWAMTWKISLWQPQRTLGSISSCPRFSFLFLFTADCIPLPVVQLLTVHDLSWSETVECRWWVHSAPRHSFTVDLCSHRCEWPVTDPPQCASQLEPQRQAQQDQPLWRDVWYF